MGPAHVHCTEPLLHTRRLYLKWASQMNPGRHRRPPPEQWPNQCLPLLFPLHPHSWKLANWPPCHCSPHPPTTLQCLCFTNLLCADRGLWSLSHSSAMCSGSTVRLYNIHLPCPVSLTSHVSLNWLLQVGNSFLAICDYVFILELCIF